VPLAFSTGAGAAARQSIGTGVLGGMIAATFLAIFLVPLFFKLVNDWNFKSTSKDFDGLRAHGEELKSGKSKKVVGHE
jgi:hypothetical protein